MSPTSWIPLFPERVCTNTHEKVLFCHVTIHARWSFLLFLEKFYFFGIINCARLSQLQCLNNRRPSSWWNPSFDRHSFTLQSAKCDAELHNYLQVFSFCVISTGEADQLDLCRYRTCYTGGANHFIFFLPPLRMFQSYSPSFHGRAPFNGELVAILMRVLFGHSTPVYSRPARPTVALLWRRHWKTSTHLSPTDTNQGDREKRSKRNDRLLCY